MNANLHYDFIAPRQIVFGWGRRREVGSLAKRLGRRAFLVSGLPDVASRTALPEVIDWLRAEDVAVIEAGTIDHEPEVADVDRLSETLRGHGATEGDFLLGIGGGAAVDWAKGAAAMATNAESPTVKDYLEGVGRGLKLTRAPLPVLAMPTTAGTGAEATKNAVISSYDPPFKKSLRDDRMVPRVALVDPQLSVSVPPEVTAASGMDAITQLFESYLSKKARPIPQALAVQGLRLAVPVIAEAVEDGSRREARERMAHAALLSGMALANSGLGFAHGVAPVLGTRCRVPHGLACAVLLPTALRVNREVRRDELARLAHLLYRESPSKSPEKAVDVLIQQIEGLCRRVGVPARLSHVGVRPEQIPTIARESLQSSSMKGNPRELSEAELSRLLEDLL